MKTKTFFILLWVFVIALPKMSAQPIPITPENAGQLKQIARYGSGTFTSDFEWSPDGEMVAIASTIGVWLYHVSNFVADPRLLDHDARVDDVAYSPDARMIAAVENDRVHIWDVESGERLRTITGRSAVAFSPNSRWLATGGETSFVELWDVRMWKVKSRFERRNTAPLTRLLFNADSSRLAALVHMEAASGSSGVSSAISCCGVLSKYLPHAMALENGDIRSKRPTSYEDKPRGAAYLWSVEQPAAPLMSLEPQSPYAWVNDIAFSPDGQTWAVAASTGLLRYDTTTAGEKPAFLAGEIVARAAYDDERIAVTLLRNHYIALAFLSTSGEIMREMMDLPEYMSPRRIAFNIHGSLGSLGGAPRQLELWNSAMDRIEPILYDTDESQIYASPYLTAVSEYNLGNIRRLVDPVSGLDLRISAALRSALDASSAPNHPIMAVLGSDLELWDLQQQAAIRHFDVLSGSRVALSPSTNLIALLDPLVPIVCCQTGVTIYDTTIGEVVQRLQPDTDEDLWVEFSADDRWIMVGSYQGCEVWIYDIAMGELREHLIACKADFIHNLVVYDRSELYNEPTNVYDPATDQEPAIFPGTYKTHAGRVVVTLEFDYESESGLLLAGVHIYDTSTNRHILSIDETFGHLGDPTILSPDAKFLVIAINQLEGSNEPDRFRIYDLATGRPILDRPGRRGYTAAFSPDQQLVALAEENEVVLVELATGREVAVLRGHNGRVTRIVFGTDGSLLLTRSSFDETVRVWAVDV